MQRKSVCRKMKLLGAWKGFKVYGNSSPHALLLGLTDATWWAVTSHNKSAAKLTVFFLQPHLREHCRSHRWKPQKCPTKSL
jgi:hypothetical protein